MESDVRSRSAAIAVSDRSDPAMRGARRVRRLPGVISIVVLLFVVVLNQGFPRFCLSSGRRPFDQLRLRSGEVGLEDRCEEVR